MTPTSDSTVNPTLRPKRDKKTTQNTEFAAFARRILRAYARRVADGDIEALRSLTTLASDVDNATRDAVRGLRLWGYSWSDIADCLGVSRQAAQHRWGNPTDRGALDRRLLNDGLAVTVPTLVAVFAAHHPGTPRSESCPACGHYYRPGEVDCPTNTVVRPLLYVRRQEDHRALTRLPREVFTDLHDQDAARASILAARSLTRHPYPTGGPLALFDLTGETPR
jgi:hypothetical protein